MLPPQNIKITEFYLRDFRCVQRAQIRFGTQINAIFGPNSSGKTSLLEALYMLSTSRSFRTHKMGSVIRHNQPQLEISGQLQTEKGHLIELGVKRHCSGKLRATVDGRLVATTSELAAQLPLQLISPYSASLLMGSPESRRSFLDSGLFYTDPSFQQGWSRYQRCLKQRNAALKLPVLGDDFPVWEQEMAQAGERVSMAREQYVCELWPFFCKYNQHLLGDMPLRWELFKGWQESVSLTEALAKNRDSDRRSGYSRQGPHKSDLTIFLGGAQAKEVLSGGQAKLMTCAMRLAQAELLKDKTDRCSIFLIDDLASELDGEHLGRVLSVLQQLEAQLILTALDQSVVDKIKSAGTGSRQNAEVQVFEIKDGHLLVG